MCKSAAGLFINGEWMTLDDILSDKAKEDGCFQAKSSKERAVHFIMSQIFYQELESPDALEMEAVFDLPDFTDDITILWQNGTAVGFYSTKQKGVTDERTAEQYPMVTLDSIYVSPFHRRCGAATKLLEHLAATHCDQDIAVSTPISSTMRKEKKLVKHCCVQCYIMGRAHLWCGTIMDAEEISCRETNIPAKILGSRRDRTRRRQKIDMVFSSEERKTVTED
ncbi:protein FAM169B-like isoform X3 [Schistocerca serialis cubense]|uniref:protein FAM169B-like isoform X3 n=1 Tax=Schistocerca serialis cubense TaxID=2023355 RepID=UPI00214E9DCB|nr:protein FAM169B-like isoform X3 [Schistocerca serialis cubense]